MSQISPPPPSTRDLLPPLLACLPTSFISPQAPPALLPLLAPVLRQRVSFLSSSGSSGNDGWLPLLSWDSQKSPKLSGAVERMVLEPHPVSGEIELEDLRAAKYRRLDEETLHARLEVEQFDLLPTFVWIENDEHGGTGPGWKLTDLKSLEDVDDGTAWFDTPVEANDAAAKTSLQMAGSVAYPTPPSQDQQAHDEDDGDDYWASYDRTPGHTPAPMKPSPAPQAQPSAQRAAERDYYDRYGSEVQPALDSHDPDEDHPEITNTSSLTGDALLRAQAAHLDQALPLEDQSHLSMPRPISPTSSHSSVDRLEEQAAAMSSDHGNRAQFGIKQHISTDIKSLFRLARSAGMERSEFERIVRTELECLGMMEGDE